MPVGKLLFQLAVPTIAAQVINALYNMVDRIYIGRLPGGEGPLAIAGLVPDEELNENNILPEAFDPRVADVVSRAVRDHI